MAYTPKPKFGEDEKEGMFTNNLTTTSPSPVGTASGGTPSAPQAPQAKEAPSASAGPGTGFVNIDRMLAANKGIGADVAKAGQTALAGENRNLSKAANQMFVDTQIGGGAFGGLKDVSQNINRLGVGASQADMDAIREALNAGYTGPNAFNYSTGTGAKQARGLANEKTTGMQLAENAGTLAGYSPQMAAIDRALYGQEASAVQARKDVGTGLDTLNKDVAGTQKAAQGWIDQARSNVDQYRTGVADRLRQQGQRITNVAQNKADEANRAEQQARADMGQFGSNTQWIPGSGAPAQAGNFLGNESAQSLDFIAQALGDPSLAQQRLGNWSPGKAVTTPYDYEAARAQQREANAAAQQRAAEATAEQSRLATNTNADLGTIFGTVFGGPLGLLGMLNRR